MLVRFPPGSAAVVVRAYAAPYPDPIAARTGEAVQIDPARSAKTDILGWLWCRAADGREGWVPEAWLNADSRLTRDFDARELGVEPGERVTIELAESGFVLCRKADGRQGWLPDGVLRLSAELSWRA